MRSDYKIILDLIPENSKVLDIGCLMESLYLYWQIKI